MDLVATSADPGVELVGVCGTPRSLTRSFVGPYAVHTVLGHFADRLFLSVKGVTRDGALTDADPLEADVKAAMIAHAQEAFLLIDDSKLRARGLNAVGHVADLAGVFAHGVAPPALARLRATGVEVRAVAGAAA
jgi:DeoR/GlpR family transcriptional regulator of sugar metabolism